MPKCPNGDDCQDFKNGQCQFMHKNEEVKKDGSVWKDRRPPKEPQRNQPQKKPDEEVKG
jgi:hypothetical protein